MLGLLFLFCKNYTNVGSGNCGPL